MSASTPSYPVAERNLLVGILALQMDFIGRDALIVVRQEQLSAPFLSQETLPGLTPRAGCG